MTSNWTLYTYTLSDKQAIQYLILNTYIQKSKKKEAIGLEFVGGEMKWKYREYMSKVNFRG